MTTGRHGEYKRAPKPNKKRAICIVDDEPEERERFKNALKDYFDVGIGSSPEEALEDLKRKPDLYLLDLYESNTPVVRPEAREELQAARKRFLKALADFQRTLARFEQTKDRSFANASRLCGRIRKQPFAFFTRKGMLDDIVAAYARFGRVPLIKKPEPEAKDVPEDSSLDQVYDAAVRLWIDRLKEDIGRAIDEFGFWAQYGDFLLVAVCLAFGLGVCSSLAANLLWFWCGEKVLWFLVIILLLFTAALIYFFLGRIQRRW
jgi:CheY-like chemotaxis protein